MKIKIAIADDHDLIRQGIAKLIEEADFEVIIQACNGEDLIKQLENQSPDLILMDINMPVKNGIDTTKWIETNKAEIKVIALSALDDDINVIRMLKAGARGYLLKSSQKAQLVQAIRDVHQHGYHFSDLVSGKLIKTLHTDQLSENAALGISFSEQEVTFIKYLCTEMTNKEIADKMCVSPRTSEGWRKNICDKLNVKTRVGIVLYSMRNRLVE
ncbi:MAG: two-component system invasion response regulator UvrY [Flavobacteriales bacterium]|jgi:two-component system invasion response regulator UvrY